MKIYLLIVDSGSWDDYFQRTIAVFDNLKSCEEVRAKYEEKLEQHKKSKSRSFKHIYGNFLDTETSVYNINKFEIKEMELNKSTL